MRGRGSGRERTNIRSGPSGKIAGVTTTPAATGTSLGERFAAAVAAKDRAALLELLAADVDFRAMTPAKFWEASSATDVVDVITGTWFGPDRRIDAVERVEHDVVVDRERTGYRFRVTLAEGPHVVEQQAYLGADEAGRVTWLRIMCTGFRPADD